MSSHDGFPGKTTLKPIQGDTRIVMSDGSVLNRMELRVSNQFADGIDQPRQHAESSHRIHEPEITDSAPTLSPTSSELEKHTLELIAKRGASMSRLEIEKAVGINKNRAAYVLRKLEKEGSVVSSGSARNTSYALA